MKKIVSILAALMMCFTLSSCVTTAQAQIDDMYDDVDVSVVVTYGVPYYNAEGLILYYIYRDMYYYPFLYNDRYYFHRYRRPLPPDGLGRYKPVPRDFYNHRPHHHHNHQGGRPHHHNGGIHNGGRPHHHNGGIHNGGTRPHNNGRQYHINTDRGTRPSNNINVRPNGGMRPHGNATHSAPRSSTRHGNFGGRR